MSRFVTYLDRAVPRRIDGWGSLALDLHMPIVSYGDRGHPLLLFPTATAAFLENERFYLVKSIEPAILLRDGRTPGESLGEGPITVVPFTATPRL